MADIEKTVSILFQGKDLLSDSIGKMEKNLNSFSDKAQKVTQPLADIATSIITVNAAINTLLAGGIVLATKKAGEFGDSFAEITTLTKATSQQIEIFRGDILEYANDSTKSIDDINAAVYTAISAGTNYSESLDLTRQAEKLAIASKADLEPTTRLLAATMNAYGASTDEAGKYSDIFFKTVESGLTTLPELANSISNVSGIAANAGIPIETLSAAIATITAKGAPTEQAVTRIKAAIDNIIKPTKTASDTAEELGIQFDASALASRGLEGVLTDVMKATGGNIDTLGKLFGSTKALSAALDLAGGGGEKFRGILNDMQNAAGSTETAYGKMADNFGLANQKLVNNINTTIIKIGDKIIDKYGDVVGALTEAIGVIGAGVDSSTFAPIWSMLDEFGDDLVEGFNNIRDNLPEALKLVDIGPLVDSYKGLGGAIKDAIEAIFGEINLTTPEGMAEAIDKIFDAMTALNNITTGIIKGMKPFLELIGDGIEKFRDMDKNMADTVGQVLGFATGLNEILKHSKAITGFFSVLAGAVLVNAASNITGLIGALTGLGTGLSVLSAGAIAAGAAAGIVLLADELGERLAPVVDSTIEYFDNLAGSIFGYQTATQKAAEEQQKLIDDLSGVDENLQDMTNTIDKMNAEIDAGLSGASAEELSKSLDEWGLTQKGWEKINGAWINVKYKAEIDEASIEETKQKVEEVETEQELKIEVDKEAIETELEKIKAQAEIVSTSLEWKAKLDIAEVEASSKDLETMFESLNTSISDTGNTLSDLWGTLAGGDLDFFARVDLDAQLRAEEKRRQDAFNLQKLLTEQQIKLNDLKLEALERGDAMITIDGAGLQPELEAFMWKIIEAIQIRANSEGAEFLLGV